MRKNLIQPKVITALLFLQLIPLVMFPPASFSPDSQEWWLPVLLAVLSLAGVVQLVFRHSYQNWPWHLISFAHGFNIISRILMLFQHSSYVVSGNWVIDVTYVSITLLSMLLSGFFLYYLEWPEVRLGLLAHD
jgi:hypothetical protein